MLTYRVLLLKIDTNCSGFKTFALVQWKLITIHSFGLCGL